MFSTLFGLDEWNLTTISWFAFFLSLMSYIGLLVAQATQVSSRRVLASEASDFGGIQPVFATAGAGAATAMAGGSPGLGSSTYSGEGGSVVPMAGLARVFGRLGTALAILGCLMLLAALFVRANTSGHIPYMSLYEICLVLTLGIALAYLLIGELWLKVRAVGPFALLIVFLVQSYALLTIPQDLKTAQQLVPALQSSWLPIHVSQAILAYSCFALAAGAAMMYLLKYHAVGRWTRVLPSLAATDEFMFRAVTVGFPFQTLLLITGAYWAQTAWSRAWAWDPKEVWALITWLSYAALLHVRVMRGWRGTTVAWMAIAGFAVVLTTFIGVNYLVEWFGLSSLHAYSGAMPKEAGGILEFAVFGIILVALLGGISYAEIRRRRQARARRQTA